MHILLDCDGVLADFVTHALTEVNDLLGLTDPFTPEHVTKWEVESLLLPHLHTEFFDRIRSKGWCADMPLMQGAGHVWDLRAHGHAITIVTTPLKGSPYWREERLEWVRQHFGDIPVRFREDKSCEKGNIFVDDKPEHVLAWRERNPQGRALLMDAPYNRRHKDLDRIYTLREVLC